jgi:acyl-CoA dehydrogenase
MPLGSGTQERCSAHPPVIEALKAKAKQLGLWNLFLPQNHFSQGAGFSNLEYGLMAEWLGRSVLASEVKGNPKQTPPKVLHFH